MTKRSSASPFMKAHQAIGKSLDEVEPLKRDAA
jgi:hypothetical protein